MFNFVKTYDTCGPRGPGGPGGPGGPATDCRVLLERPSPKRFSFWSHLLTSTKI